MPSRSMMVLFDVERQNSGGVGIVCVSNLFKIGVYERRRGATTKTVRVTIMIWFPKAAAAVNNIRGV